MFSCNISKIRFGNGLQLLSLHFIGENCLYGLFYLEGMLGKVVILHAQEEKD